MMFYLTIPFSTRFHYYSLYYRIIKTVRAVTVASDEELFVSESLWKLCTEQVIARKFPALYGPWR